MMFTLFELVQIPDNTPQASLEDRTATTNRWLAAKKLISSQDAEIV